MRTQYMPPPPPQQTQTQPPFTAINKIYINQNVQKKNEINNHETVNHKPVYQNQRFNETVGSSLSNSTLLTAIIFSIIYYLLLKPKKNLDEIAQLGLWILFEFYFIFL